MVRAFAHSTGGHRFDPFQPVLHDCGMCSLNNPLPTPYNRVKNVLSASLNKTFPSSEQTQFKGGGFFCQRAVSALIGHTLLTHSNIVSTIRYVVNLFRFHNELVCH